MNPSKFGSHLAHITPTWNGRTRSNEQLVRMCDRLLREELSDSQKRRVIQRRERYYDCSSLQHDIIVTQNRNDKVIIKLRRQHNGILPPKKTANFVFVQQIIRGCFSPAPLTSIST